jgi:P-type Cu+ transporter
MGLVNYTKKVMDKITLKLKGMLCAGCASSIETATRNISGVASSNVNFASEEVAIEYDAQKTSPAAIQKVIKDIGYEAVLPEQVNEDADKKARLTATESGSAKKERIEENNWHSS